MKFKSNWQITTLILTWHRSEERNIFFSLYEERNSFTFAGNPTISQSSFTISRYLTKSTNSMWPNIQMWLVFDGLWHETAELVYSRHIKMALEFTILSSVLYFSKLSVLLLSMISETLKNLVVCMLKTDILAFHDQFRRITWARTSLGRGIFTLPRFPFLAKEFWSSPLSWIIKYY